MSPPRTTNRAEQLGKQLGRARWRGLGDLDLHLPPKHRPVDVPDLEALARTYCTAMTQTPLGRVEQITLLVRDGLSAYSAAGYKSNAFLIEWLFFGDPKVGHSEAAQADRSPTTLLYDARKDSGLDEDRFAKRRRSAFTHFAEFLYDFVDAAIRPSEPRAEDDSAPTEQESRNELADRAERVAIPSLASGPPGRRRRRRRFAVIGGIILAITVAITVPLSTGSGANKSPGAPVTIVGQVTCASGAPAVAVWIQTLAGSNSGWAASRRTSSNTARYQYVLPRDARYSVHVGCGGTNHQWASDNRSGYVPVTEHAFICHDQPASPPARSYGTCTPN